MGLKREEVYLTNLCKFRPALPGQTTNNRPPRAQEIAYSLPFFEAELEIVRPTMIVALGATAAQGLLGFENTKPDLTALRGSWHDFQGYPLRISHHPSFLLLDDKDAGQEKRKIWEDMLVTMEKLSLPISDKQRGYFTK